MIYVIPFVNFLNILLVNAQEATRKAMMNFIPFVNFLNILLVNAQETTG